MAKTVAKLRIYPTLNNIILSMQNKNIARINKDVCKSFFDLFVPKIQIAIGDKTPQSAQNASKQVHKHKQILIYGKFLSFSQFQIHKVNSPQNNPQITLV